MASEICLVGLVLILYLWLEKTLKTTERCLNWLMEGRDTLSIVFYKAYPQSHDRYTELGIHVTISSLTPDMGCHYDVQRYLYSSTKYICSFHVLTLHDYVSACRKKNLGMCKTDIRECAQ